MDLTTSRFVAVIILLTSVQKHAVDGIAQNISAQYQIFVNSTETYIITLSSSTGSSNLFQYATINSSIQEMNLLNGTYSTKELNTRSSFNDYKIEISYTSNRTDAIQESYTHGLQGPRTIGTLSHFAISMSTGTTKQMNASMFKGNKTAIAQITPSTSQYQPSSTLVLWKGGASKTSPTRARSLSTEITRASDASMLKIAETKIAQITPSTSQYQPSSTLVLWKGGTSKTLPFRAISLSSEIIGASNASTPRASEVESWTSILSVSSVGWIITPKPKQKSLLQIAIRFTFSQLFRYGKALLAKTIMADNALYNELMIELAKLLLNVLQRALPSLIDFVIQSIRPGSVIVDGVAQFSSNFKGPLAEVISNVSKLTGNFTSDNTSYLSTEITNGSIKVTDINECLTITCHKNANCINVDYSYRCECMAGYTGDGVMCTFNKVNDYTLYIAIGVALGLLAILVGGMIIFCCRRAKRPKKLVGFHNLGYEMEYQHTMLYEFKDVNLEASTEQKTETLRFKSKFNGEESNADGVPFEINDTNKVSYSSFENQS